MDMVHGQSYNATRWASTVTDTNTEIQIQIQISFFCMTVQKPIAKAVQNY